MPDLRPVLFVVGLMIAGLGVTMFIPMMVDLAYKGPTWQVFGISGAISTLFGAIMALACYAPKASLRARGAFLLTTLSWIALSVFAAVPLFMADIGLDLTDSLFEAVSGITTTGSTVMTGLDDASKGVLIWRAILHTIRTFGLLSRHEKRFLSANNFTTLKFTQNNITNL